jgi:outer membrane cobalamin receptor
MTCSKLLVCLIVLIIILFEVRHISAQSTLNVFITVKDGSGSSVPDSSLDVFRDGQVVATGKTGSDGGYVFLLPQGRYQVKVWREGFIEQVIELAVAKDSTIDFHLDIAPIDDHIVVTASRTPELRAVVPEALTVFTAEDIRRFGSRSISDILQEVPGLHVESTGREGALASLFTRGGESDYNYVLIDGVRVNDNGGQFDFSRILGGEIERVEIVRGAQSALYGSDAIGAVVQIFTNRRDQIDAPKLSGAIERGSFGTWRSDVQLLGNLRQFVDYQLGIAYHGTDGAFLNVLPESDRFDQISLNSGVSLTLSEQSKLQSNIRYTDSRGRAPGQIKYGPGDRGTREDAVDLLWSFRFDQHFTQHFNHTITGSYFRSDRLSEDIIADPSHTVNAILSGQPGAYFPDSPRLVRLIDQTSFEAFAAEPALLDDGQFLATTPFGINDFLGTFKSQFRRPVVNYQLNLRWGEAHLLSAGYEYQREIDPLRGFLVKEHSYFARHRSTIADRWHFTAGARLDTHSNYRKEFSPKLSAGGYLIPLHSGIISSMKVFSNIGKGIKAPTFSEFFGSTFVDGNRNLSPERARTIDAGIEVTFDDQRWLGRVIRFDNAYRKQVAFVASSNFGKDGIPDFINIEGSKASGFEFEGRLLRPIVGVTASATYAFVDTKVVTTLSTSEQFQPGQALLRRPKHSGTFRIVYTRGAGGFYMQLRSIGQRHDASFLGLVRLLDSLPVDITVNPGYTVVSLGGHIRLHDNLTLFIKANNLFDKDYQSALGYPGMPRTISVGGRFMLSN